MNRLHYIDNLRWIWIVMLIPFHTAMAWNCWESNYIYYAPNKPLSSLLLMLSPFFMPLLFVLAGMSMNFALRKRSISEFTMERLKKLFLPLLSGLVTVCAYLSYTADRFFNNYKLGFFSHYRKFFTTVTDLTGYDGGFTPAHLWFLLYLFIASLTLLVVVKMQRHFLPSISFGSMKMWMLLVLCIFPIAFSYILDFGGKSVGESFALVTLGYYVFSEKDVVSKLEKNKYILLLSTLIASSIYAYTFVWRGASDSLICIVCSEISKWCGVLGFLGVGSRFLNMNNRFTHYMRSRSFLIYIFHFPWIVFLQYSLRSANLTVACSYILTVAISLLLTFLSVEVVSRIPGLRFLFGYKPVSK